MKATAWQWDWKEKWIDRMGLIVALSGAERYAKLGEFKRDMQQLSDPEQCALRTALCQRFTPSNGSDGCQSATASVREVTHSHHP